MLMIPLIQWLRKSRTQVNKMGDGEGMGEIDAMRE
jgi:hypothetical protein